MTPISTVTVAEFRRMQPAGRKQQPETPIRKGIRDYLMVHGWKVARILQSMGSEKGIPDLVAIRDGVTVWLEVKKPGGKLSDYQQAWRDDCLAHGGKWMLAMSVEDVEPLGLRDRKGCEHD